MRFATWLTLTVMFGGLVVARGFHRPEGAAVPDSGLARIRGLSHGSGTETKDVCAGQNLQPRDDDQGVPRITAAQCVESPGSGLRCVSCGTGQVVIKPNSAGDRTDSPKDLLSCRDFQKNVGWCWRGEGTVYSCRDMQVFHDDRDCANGTYKNVLWQRQPLPPGGVDPGDPISP